MQNAILPSSLPLGHPYPGVEPRVLVVGEFRALDNVALFDSQCFPRNRYAQTAEHDITNIRHAAKREVLIYRDLIQSCAPHTAHD